MSGPGDTRKQREAFAAMCVPARYVEEFVERGHYYEARPGCPIPGGVLMPLWYMPEHVDYEAMGGEPPFARNFGGIPTSGGTGR